MLEPDTVVQGRYRLLRPLSRNPLRQTWLAMDVHEQVVLKVLAAGLQWDDFKLFEREAQTLRQLTHPRIPRYLDHFHLDDGQLWFALVQEYIPAPSLRECLARGMRFEETQIRRLASEVLEILCYLHALSPPVLHRDIKPSNLLIAQDGRVYLVDFGAAQNQAAVEGSTFTVVGTYGYTPMEQFGGRAEPSSDLYALGATLIHLATGSAPADLPQVALRVQFRDRTGLGSILVRWLEQMTEPALERRFLSARAALEALVEAGDGAPSAAPSPASTNPWRCLHLLSTHQDIVQSVAFAPGGKVLASASWDRTVHLWNAADGELLRVLEGHRSRVLSVAFTADGRTLLSAGADRRVGLWDWESGRLKCMLKGPAEPVLVAHGRTLVLAGDGRVAIWERGAETFRDLPHRKMVPGSPLAISDRLLSLCNRENRIELYDLVTGKLYKDLPAHPPYLAFSSVLSMPDYRPYLQLAKTPPNITLGVVALAFGPDGRTLAIAVKRGSLVYEPDHEEKGSLRVFEPDQIYLWDVESGKLLRSMEGHGEDIHRMAFEGRRLATASGGQDKSIKLWAADSGEKVQELAGHTGIVYTLAFAADGRTLASGSGDSTVRLWKFDSVAL